MVKSFEAISRGSVIFGLLCAFLLAIFGSAPLFASANDRTIVQYAHTAWGLKDGAPSAIEALAQTEDGYLWIGTANGLFRFDGVLFERYEPDSGPALPGRNVRSMLALPNGDLWVGFQYGSIALLRNGLATNYTTRDGLPNGHVLGLAQDVEGTIWAATSMGLARLEGNRWKEVGSDWNFPGKAARTVYLDHQGRLWVATEETLVFLPSGSRRFQPTGIQVGYVAQITQAANGRLWMAETSRCVRPVPQLNSVPPSADTQIWVGSGRILLDREGALWITSLGDGLRRAPVPERLNGKIAEHSNALESFTAKDGLTDDSNRAILQDREGDIWVGTENGLDQFRKTNIVPVTLPGNISEASLSAGDAGDVWLNVQGRLYRVHGGSEYALMGHMSGANSTYRDPAGIIFWSAADHIFAFQDGRISQYAIPRQPSAPYTGQATTILTEDHSGVLWADKEREGLFYFEHGAWRYFETPPELARLTPTTGLTDWNGHLWFGYVGGTIISIDGAKIHELSSSETSPVGSVEVIRGRGRHIWVGGEQGLAFFNGRRFQPVIPVDTPTFERVSGIEETPNGDLWICETRGVIHIASSEVRKILDNSSYRVQYEIFDSRDGLPGNFQGSGSTGSEVQGTDGRVWFVATKGLAWIDPARLYRNSIAPPVSIRSIKADGRQYRSWANLILPARTMNLQIDYTARSLSVPERVRFRYKLEGMDKQWQDAGTRREAFFTQLSPRRYRFRVIACNNDGVWNDVGASLDFSVAPAWYQTVWAWCLLVMIVASILWAAYRVRVKQIAAAISERFDERLAERVHLAQELHDTFLQTVQVSMMVAEHALEIDSDENRRRLALEKLAKWLKQAVDEGRGALYSLRDSTSQENHLSEALQRAAEDHNIPSSMTVALSVKGNARDLHPLVRDEIYRVGYEAIRNAVAHSRGTRLEIEICYASELSLRILDNGVGIDPALCNLGRRGHFGLLGMRERASRIHGKLNIMNSADGGTEVLLVVPGNLVYREPRPSFFQRLKAAVQRAFGLSSADDD